MEKSVVGVVTVSAPAAMTPNRPASMQAPVRAQSYHDDFAIRVLPTSDNVLSLARVTVESAERPGKVVVFNVDAAAMQGAGKNGFKVLLDGVAVPSVASAAALNGDNAVYYRPAQSGLSDEGTQFRVWIPHFSERTIEIMAIEEDLGQVFVTPYGLLGLALVGVVISLVAYGIGRRRGWKEQEASAATGAREARLPFSGETWRSMTESTTAEQGPPEPSSRISDWSRPAQQSDETFVNDSSKPGT